MVSERKYWRIGTGFLAIILMMVGLEVLSIRMAADVASHTSNLYNHPLTVSNAVLEANANIISMHRYMKDVALARTPGDMETAISNVAAHERMVLSNLDVVLDRFLGDRAKIEAVRTSFIDWRAIRSDVITLMRQGRREEAAAITKGRGADHVAMMGEQMRSLILFARAKASEFLETGTRQHRAFSLLRYSLLAGGAAIGCAVALFVILGARKADRSLRESERRFHAVFDQTFQFMGILDPRGILLEINQTSLDLVGIPRKEVMGRSFWETPWWAHSPAQQEKCRQAVARAAKGEFVRFETQYPGSDKGTTVIDFSIKPIVDESGATVFLVPEGRNITDLKQAEEKLSQAQKMDAIGHLTGGVAHDFNNILSIALGNLELAQGGLDEGTREYECVGKSIAAVRRGAALTHRLLAFSRKQVLRPRLTDINTLVVGMLDLLSRTLGENIDIQTVSAGHLWICEIDPSQMETALLNLAINARDAMPEGGKLTLETANRTLGKDDLDKRIEVVPGDYILVAVTDTGSGIPPENRDRIFEPFFTTKEKSKGTGLGLSMVYGFAKQSGGHVEVYSEVGEGTTVKVYLPRATTTEAARPEADDPDAEALDGGNERVLVVEDEPEVRNMVVAMLKDLGYGVRDAATADEALAQVSDDEPLDLLLTDVILAHGMSGLALSREILRIRPDVKILFMSGYTENAIVHQGRLDEGTLLLQKPFQTIELAAMVREALTQGETEE